MRVLYISYDGLTDPIGRSQILPYLEGCAAQGHRITVISFEKPQRLASSGPEVARLCAGAAIDWRPQRFHRFPPMMSKAYDLWAMGRTARAAICEATPFDLIHARSYQAGWTALGLKRRHGVPMLFDMRGFWADQRREGGRWSGDNLVGRSLYRTWKEREAEMLNAADHVVVLSEAARNDIMNRSNFGGQPVSVIPCCADFELFTLASPETRTEEKARLGFGPDDPVLAYLGSIGTVYRYDEHLKLFAAIRARDPRTKLLHIGADPAECILAMASELGIGLAPEQLVVRNANRDEVAGLLASTDVGTAFCAGSFSSKGVSPTKIGEYLACGVPVIGNDAVGDTAALLHELECGHSLPDFSASSLDEAVNQFFRWRQCDRQALRERAKTMFDLPLAVKGYAMIYDSLTPLRIPGEG